MILMGQDELEGGEAGSAGGLPPYVVAYDHIFSPMYHASHLTPCGGASQATLKAE